MIAYGTGAAVLAAAAACAAIAPAAATAPRAAPPGTAAAPAAPRAAGHALQDDFAAAAAEFSVPRGVLMAVSYRETRWESHGGQPSVTGNYNVMGLTQVRAQDLARPGTVQREPAPDLGGDPDAARHHHASQAGPAVPGGRAAVDTADPRLHTLDDAAALIGADADALKTGTRQNVRGAAALLASYEKAATGGLPADAGQWYPAVARYGGPAGTAGADQFARRVYATVRDGASRVTADGQRVTLAADPAVRPAAPATPATSADSGAADCPSTLACSFVAAAFAQNSSADDDFGNYNPANRPASGEDIRYIVIHDMEGTFDGTIQEFQNSGAYASAHYLVAADGRVTQMVRTKDEAWHAANKTVNMHSIGVEHEGYAMKAGSWFAEPEYDSSAALVAHLAQEFGVPLDRGHIIGHDEVPGILDANVAGQHWDPGPYWDWNHYMTLLGHPDDQGTHAVPAVGDLVRIVPPYTTANQPALTSGGTSAAAHPANFVYLVTSPSSTAYATDPYLGSPLWSEGSNWADKAVAGSEYVVAGTSGTDWTAIWYGGRKLWFHNPGGTFTVPVTGGQAVTPAGGDPIAVYGRAYPQDSAYAAKGVPVQSSNDSPLTKYTIPAGQSYAVAGPEAVGDYYYAGSYAGTKAGDRTLVTGTNEFFPIRYNHRIAWVRAADVTPVAATTATTSATAADGTGAGAAARAAAAAGAGTEASGPRGQRARAAVR